MFLEIFTKSLGLRYHYLDVTILVVVADVDAVVTETVLSLCVAVFVVGVSLKSIRGCLGYLHPSKAPFICSL